MNCQVYLKDGRLCVGFNQSSLVIEEIQYPLGDAAVRFSSLPVKVFKFLLGSFRSEFLRGIEKEEPEEKILETFAEFIRATDGLNPYVYFYMDFYLSFLFCLRRQRSEIPRLLKSFVFEDEHWDIDNKDFTDIPESSLWVAGLLLTDAQIRQARLKEDFEAITGSAEEYNSLTQMQRLYLLSRQGRNYLSGEFKTTLKPDYQISPKETDVSKLKSTLLENKVDIVEMVEIKNLDNLLSYELYHTIKSDLPLRRCKHCGEFFIVRGRIDTEYCDRIKDGETKPCALIGATRSYWDSKVGNATYAEFQKAYKRNHSRRRVGTMTANEFFEWSEEAREKRGQCEDGRLTLDEFKIWLGNKR
jgi:hypothetical protein